MNPRLRLMRAADADRVAAIASQDPGEGWSAASFRRDLETNRASRYIVLIDEPAGTVLGYGGIWLVVGEAHIVNMGVESGLRRRGLGRLVLFGLVRLAIACAVDVLTLEVRISNTAARTLYGEFGFYRVGERRAYYRDNGEDALVMSTESLESVPYRQRLAAIEQRIERSWPGAVGAFVPAAELQES